MKYHFSKLGLEPPLGGSKFLGVEPEVVSMKEDNETRNTSVQLKLH